MKRFCTIICLFTLLFSCNSDEDIQDIQQSEPNFYALTVGNSWVYKWYELDDRNENPNLFTGVSETVSIEDIETIDNETYYKFKRVITGNPLDNLGNPIIINIEGNGEYFEFLRDSSGYLINEAGLIKCVNNTYEEILIDTEFDGLESIFGQVSEDNITYNTEAGVFNSLEFILSLSVYQSTILHGISYYYYSDGIGLVSNINRRFVNCDFCGFFEKRLDSYNLQ